MIHQNDHEVLAVTGYQIHVDHVIKSYCFNMGVYGDPRANR